MSRAPVCHYYQAGNCRNGDECTYFHPEKKCRNIIKTGWCPYGYNCHFWHDSAQTADKQVKPIEKPCQFFINNHCKYGENCSFSHDLNGAPKAEGVTLDEYKAMKSMAALTLSRDSFVVPDKSARSTSRASFDSYFMDVPRDAFSDIANDQLVTPASQEIQNRPVFERPCRSLTEMNTLDVNDGDIYRLQNLEIDRLLKCFAKDNIKEGNQIPEGRIFFLRFSSTDPDWGYSVREVLLHILIKTMYPKQDLKVTVPPDGALPSILVEHMNTSIATWIHDRHELLQKSDRLEIYLRPLLQWLDRNLENLFTQGLRKFKAHLLGGARTVDNSDSTGTQPHVDVDPSESSVSCENSDVDTDRQSSPSGSDSELYSTSDSEMTATEGGRVVDDDEVSEWVEPVVPSSSTTTNTSGTHQSNEALTSSTSGTHPSSKALTSSTLPATQTLRLADIRLLGSSGVYIQNKIFATMHCIRCRQPFSWYFNFHGNLPFSSPTSPNSENEETTSILSSAHLQSLKPHSINCARCRIPMKLYFQASVAHAHDNLVGAFHLTGCVVDDIPFGHSVTNLLCTGCNKYIKVKNLIPGKGNSQRCFLCHTVVGVQFSRFLIESQNKPGATVMPSSGEPSRPAEAVATDKPGVSRKLRRTLKDAHDPILKDGDPLPLYGTCVHYRKSYRWLRFPCCGILQPCDVCHDKATGDSHELEMATRMVCGFCSKEQAFSSTQPCVRCGKRVTGSRSAHWEGGKGCRNKVTMSRKDPKKYSQTNKTIPKNANKK